MGDVPVYVTAMMNNIEHNSSVLDVIHQAVSAMNSLMLNMDKKFGNLDAEVKSIKSQLVSSPNASQQVHGQMSVCRCGQVNDEVLTAVERHISDQEEVLRHTKLYPFSLKDELVNVINDNFKSQLAQTAEAVKTMKVFQDNVTTVLDNMRNEANTLRESQDQMISGLKDVMDKVTEFRDHGKPSEYDQATVTGLPKTSQSTKSTLPKKRGVFASVNKYKRYIMKQATANGLPKTSESARSTLYKKREDFASVNEYRSYLMKQETVTGMPKTSESEKSTLYKKRGDFAAGYEYRSYLMKHAKLGMKVKRINWEYDGVNVGDVGTITKVDDGITADWGPPTGRGRRSMSLNLELLS